ncbi:hypothetical protein AtDm6_0871 [Acetobacter tropicalis]|uniref:Uncharacterized protein n=1 Tax=Acetobacter tropicalis TaxID=104102 RepID=A0A094YT55_9PROT|nr:hypothetical protein AtDm6_0871 [Acetobacter tropicalis]
MFFVQGVTSLLSLMLRPQFLNPPVFPQNPEPVLHLLAFKKSLNRPSPVCVALFCPESCKESFTFPS